MIPKRQYLLIRELIESPKFYPTRRYADMLHVSTRTIHSDLNEIEGLIKAFDCSIVKKPGKGIFLDGKIDNKMQMLQYLQIHSHPKDLSPEQRKIQILEKLIDGNTVSYQNLSKQYMVSRSSIANDIKHIKKICSTKNLQLTFNNEGTFLIGKEKDIQFLYKRILLKKFEMKFNSSPTNLIEFKQFLIEYESGIPRIFIETTFNIVFDIGEKYKLADHYLISLHNTLVILCLRVWKGKHHEKPEGYVFEKVRLLETYFIAKEIAEKILQKLNLTLTQHDIIYINEYLIAYGLRNLNITGNEGYYSRLVKQLIERFSKITNVDLNSDVKLYNGLMSHIIPMIYRLHNNILIKNPLIHEIKKQYSIVFYITWFVLIELETQLKVQIPEDEIGFIMVYFQLALERNADIKKVLIVCPAGVVTTELLKSRIQKYLPSLNLYELVTKSDISDCDLNLFDYIISTVPLNLDDELRVFYISPIPSGENLEHLAKYITSSIVKTPLISINSYKDQIQFQKFLDLDLIFTDQNFHSMSEILDFLLNELEEKNLVKKAYRKSLLEREATSSTALGNGVAIPHGNPAYVNKSKIAILVNNKKIAWGNDKVDVVLIISISKKDIKDVSTIITRINDAISDRIQIEELFFNLSKKEIYNSLFHKR